MYCSGHLDSVKWLVASQANLELADVIGRSPLDVAEEYQQDAVATFLKSCMEKEHEAKHKTDPPAVEANIKNGYDA